MSSRYAALLDAAVAELRRNVGAAEAAAAELTERLAGARRVACYGVGREGLAMRGFAMRLHHMGLQVRAAADDPFARWKLEARCVATHVLTLLPCMRAPRAAQLRALPPLPSVARLQASVVGEMTAGRVAAGDLLLASAGPGHFGTVAALAGEARRDGAAVLVLTSQPAEAVRRRLGATLALRVPAACLPPAEPVDGCSSVAAAAGAGEAAAGAALAAADAAAAPSAGAAAADARRPPEAQPEAPSPLLLGSSYELALQLFLDLVCVLLAERLELAPAALAARHTNLE